MKTRTYKELYAILLKALEDGKGRSGICGVLNNLWYEDNIINDAEYDKLYKHFKKQKPKARNKFKSFYEDPLFEKKDDWWWGWMIENPKFRAVRISFVKAILSTLN